MMGQVKTKEIALDELVVMDMKQDAYWMVLDEITLDQRGVVAQWLEHLTAVQKVRGSKSDYEL